MSVIICYNPGMITFEQYFAASLNKYPGLYAGPNIEYSMFMVCDIAFNTIGSGVSETIMHIDSNVNIEYPFYLVNNTPLYYAYDPLKANIISCGDKENPRYRILNSSVPGVQIGLFSFNEALIATGGKEEYVSPVGNVERIHPLHSKRDGGPYPNFAKRNSIVWNGISYTPSRYDLNTDNFVYGVKKNVSFSDMPTDWHEAAKTFYFQCRDYFNNEQQCSWYTHGYNKFDSKMQIKQVGDMENILKIYGDLSNRDIQLNISKDYELSFNGDIPDFLQRRWDKERSRILVFLNDTISYLDSIMQTKGLNIR